MEDKVKIFLSYSRQDEKAVLDLYNKLKEAQFSPWIDQEDIFGGEPWEVRSRLRCQAGR